MPAKARVAQMRRKVLGAVHQCQAACVVLWLPAVMSYGRATGQTCSALIAYNMHYLTAQNVSISL